MLKNFLCFCFILCCTGLHAQTIKCPDGFGVEANFIAGRIIKHSAKFTAPVPPLSTAVDVNFIWQTYGRKEWQHYRKYPLIGLGITYTDYADNRIFGKCIGIYPNIQLPLLRREHLEWTLRIGNGVGFVNRKYKAPTDTLNPAISTNINDFAIFMTDLRFKLDKHWNVQVGASFTHISNAGFSQPNLGVNLAGAHFGLRYFPSTCTPEKKVNELPKLHNRWLLQMRGGVGFIQSRSPGHPKLPTYFGSVYASRRWRGKNKYFFGTDMASCESNYAFLRMYELFPGKERSYSWDGAVFIGNEFLFGRLGLMTQVGVYYKQKYLKQDPIYQKLGANYYIIKKEHGPVKELFVSALLKTHMIIAEVAEFGIGIGL